ncbi:ATP-binding protein [Thalassobacillus sp. B23F22_16]|uniref:ATP-binding protein n=1 Tax=Thalassobacillus sp. B23F22_16 TaxID=3459513 RepID=UPI00373EDFD4
MLIERMQYGLEESDVLALFDLIDQNICLINLETKTVTCSRSVQKEISTKEEILLDDWLDLFYVYDQFGIQHSLKHVTKKETLYSKARLLFKTHHQWVRCAFKPLSHRRVAVVIQPLHKDDNSISHHMLLAEYNHKASKVKESSEALAAVQEKQTRVTDKPPEMNFAELHNQMKAITENFPHGLALINKQWQLTYANPQMERMLGKNLQSHYKHKLWQLYPISDYYLFYRHYYMALEMEQPVTFDAYMKERKMYARITIYPTDDGFTIFIQDVTIRKKYLQALQESEKRFSLLADNIKDVFWICDESFMELMYVSPRFRDLFGIPLEKRRDDPLCWWKQLTEEENYAYILEGYRKMRSENCQIEYPITTPVGEVKWIRTRGFPVQEGNEKYIVGISEDITEMKEKEAFMRQSEQLSTITQMSAGIAHEIKNPLTALKGFMQLGAANPELRDSYNDLLLSEVNRIESIVNDFMMLAKPASSKQLEAVNIKQMIEYVLELYQSLIAEKGIKIHTSIDCGEYTLESDPNRFKQILINIIKNAIEAVELKGTVCIDVFCDYSEAKIVVKDNGKGLSEERLKRLGEPFFTTKKDGTGLGIMVTRKMVDDLGGTIKYSSEEGKGTCVTIAFPM